MYYDDITSKSTGNEKQKVGVCRGVSHRRPTDRLAGLFLYKLNSRKRTRGGREMAFRLDSLFRPINFDAKENLRLFSMRHFQAPALTAIDPMKFLKTPEEEYVCVVGMMAVVSTKPHVPEVGGGKIISPTTTRRVEITKPSFRHGFQADKGEKKSDLSSSSSSWKEAVELK